MCRVLNKRFNKEKGIYIGLPSIWGNPFVIGKDGNRQNVISKYEEYILNNEYLLSSCAIYTP